MDKLELVSLDHLGRPGFKQVSAVYSKAVARAIRFLLSSLSDCVASSPQKTAGNVSPQCNRVDWVVVAKAA
jgi:hypothetical protein